MFNFNCWPCCNPPVNKESEIVITPRDPQQKEYSVNNPNTQRSYVDQISLKSNQESQSSHRSNGQQVNKSFQLRGIEQKNQQQNQQQILLSQSSLIQQYSQRSNINNKQNVILGSDQLSCLYPEKVSQVFNDALKREFQQRLIQQGNLTSLSVTQVFSPFLKQGQAQTIIQTVPWKEGRKEFKGWGAYQILKKLELLIGQLDNTVLLEKELRDILNTICMLIQGNEKSLEKSADAISQLISLEQEINQAAKHSNACSIIKENFSLIIQQGLENIKLALPQDSQKTKQISSKEGHIINKSPTPQDILVFGELHEEGNAAIKLMMKFISDIKPGQERAIFLEFLKYDESHCFNDNGNIVQYTTQELLNGYYAAPEQSQQQEDYYADKLKIILQGSVLGRGDAKQKNDDLFKVIVLAKQKGCPVIAAETVKSHIDSTGISGSDGHSRGRDSLSKSNDACVEMVQAHLGKLYNSQGKPITQALVLYGNAHITGFKDAKQGLLELFGSKQCTGYIPTVDEEFWTAEMNKNQQFEMPKNLEFN